MMLSILEDSTQFLLKSSLFLDKTFYPRSSSYETNGYIFLNGTLAETYANTSSFNDLKYSIGVNITSDNSTYVDKAYFGEVLTYQSAPSLSQRQSIEGYLATKWKLQASLPISHPYYSVYSPTAPLYGHLALCVSGNTLTTPSLPTTTTPSTTSCVVWIDASDSTTYTGTSSVTALVNKAGVTAFTSSTLYGCTGSGYSAFITANVINGLPALSLINAGFMCVPNPTRFSNSKYQSTMKITDVLIKLIIKVTDASVMCAQKWRIRESLGSLYRMVASAKSALYLSPHETRSLICIPE